MLKIGSEPFLECSTKGDKRFSAFYARIKSRNNLSIEEIYQGAKILEDGSTNHSWMDVKGKQAVNQKEVSELYSELWTEYFLENQYLINVLNEYNGFSDIFGQRNHCCQAVEIYRIKNLFKEGGI